MLKTHKYQIYNKVSLISRFPLRLLKFKRPKWADTQALLKQTTIDSLSDITKIKSNTEFWKKSSNAYRTRLKSYSFLSAIFRHSIHLKKLKAIRNVTLRQERYLTYFFNFYYKLCNLTYMTNMLSSSFEARQRIISKSLLVNGKAGSPTSLLKKGDIISLLDNNMDILKISNRFNPTLSILTNLELDYYSQNIILIKNPSELSKEDFYLLSIDYLNLQRLKH